MLDISDNDDGGRKGGVAVLVTSAPVMGGQEGCGILHQLGGVSVHFVLSLWGVVWSYDGGTTGRGGLEQLWVDRADGMVMMMGRGVSHDPL